MSNDQHSCMVSPGAGFPEGLPDVGPDGRTGDGRQGPFEHTCAWCGVVWVWRERAGFVYWQRKDG